jgi:hypothetical protein
MRKSATSIHFNIKITAFALLGAAAILWSVVPRIDRYRGAGAASCSRESQPRLFAQLESVAAKLGTIDAIGSVPRRRRQRLGRATRRTHGHWLAVRIMGLGYRSCER